MLQDHTLYLLHQHISGEVSWWKSQPLFCLVQDTPHGNEGPIFRPNSNYFIGGLCTIFAGVPEKERVEIGSQLLTCPNAALIPLWLCRRWQVVQKVVFLEQHPVLQQRKGSVVTGHTLTISTALCRRLSWKGAKEIQNSMPRNIREKLLSEASHPETYRRGHSADFSLEMPLSEARSLLPKVFTYETNIILCMIQTSNIKCFSRASFELFFSTYKDFCSSSSSTASIPIS